jgi:[NiFe] hydrogenase assembly HybE family chaperone
MSAAAVALRLEELYRAIAEGPMAGPPICNPRLSVAALGIREVEAQAVGIVVTPWFVDFVAAPLAADAAPAPAGSARRLTLPAGALDLIVGELPGFGRLDAASLFSPVMEFADMDAALGVAEGALEALFAPPSPRRCSPTRISPPRLSCPAAGRRPAPLRESGRSFAARPFPPAPARDCWTCGEHLRSWRRWSPPRRRPVRA